MQTALHRAARTAEDLGHLTLRQVVVVAQQDDLALHGRKRREQALGVEDRVDTGRPTTGPLVRQLGRVLERVDPPAARPVAAAVDRDLEEPRAERPAGREAAGPADDAEPRLLVEVVDVTAAGLTREQPKERLLPASTQLRQRGSVAGGNGGHEHLV